MVRAKELEPRPAELIAARLRDDVDHAAERAAVLRLVEVGLHHDFLNRVDRRLDAHAGLNPLDVVEAVDQLQVVVLGRLPLIDTAELCRLSSGRLPLVVALAWPSLAPGVSCSMLTMLRP